MICEDAAEIIFMIGRWRLAFSGTNMGHYVSTYAQPSALRLPRPRDPFLYR
jgi:hypothetical protein